MTSAAVPSTHFGSDPQCKLEGLATFLRSENEKTNGPFFYIIYIYYNLWLVLAFATPDAIVCVLVWNLNSGRRSRKASKPIFQSLCHCCYSQRDRNGT